MSAVVVGLVQINNSFGTASYLPYSIGLLQAYAQRHAKDPARYRYLSPVFGRLHVDEAVRQLRGADVVGISLYMWNVRLSLEIVRRLKALRPEVLVVVGGPHVPDRPLPFLLEHPFVDVVCHGEGEQAFLDILEALPGRDWTAIPGLSFLESGGGLVQVPKVGRRRDLDHIPSPYLEGIFEPLMAAHPEQVWITLWETNRGCTFQCTFCDWGSATESKVYQFGMDRLNREKDWFSDKKVEFVYCCDANFGIFPRDVDIARAMAENKRLHGYPKVFSVQNAKNATERTYAAQKVLAEAGMAKGVALAFQSIDATTLENVRRQNISLADFEELQARFTRDGIETFSDLILGLPGETYDSFIEGISRLVANGQHNRIQFNNLSALPNAEMGDPAYLKKFGMVTAQTRIINVHGSWEDSGDGIFETQDLVVATDSMPEADWRRARSVAWMAGLLHFDKLAQIPLIVMNKVFGIDYRRIFEGFMDLDAAAYPLVGSIRDGFLAFAAEIQKGGPELIYAPDWLGIYWPADEHAFIKLAAEGTLSAFYDECAGILRSLAPASAGDMAVLDEALALNRVLVKRPGSAEDIEMNGAWDVLAFYRGVLEGRAVPLARMPVTYAIRRSAESWATIGDWCREVIWYGSKKGAYLYDYTTIARC